MQQVEEEGLVLEIHASEHVEWRAGYEFRQGSCRTSHKAFSEAAKRRWVEPGGIDSHGIMAARNLSAARYARSEAKLE